MPRYRIYHLHAHSGHIASIDEIHASDDVAVIHQIQLRNYREPVEIWQGQRKVSHIDAAPQGAAFMPSLMA